MGQGAARGKVLSPKSYQEMITPAKRNGGTPLRYGLGIAVQKDPRGLPYIGHGGSAYTVLKRQ